MARAQRPVVWCWQADDGRAVYWALACDYAIRDFPAEVPTLSEALVVVKRIGGIGIVNFLPAD